jgi:GNAT superfamily N-acetyltransferase
VFLAEVGGRPAGLVRIDLLWSRIPFVAQVRVLEEDRRRGVGRAMMEFVRTRARAQGVGFVLSSSTADEAEPQAWHRAVGSRSAGSSPASTTTRSARCSSARTHDLR